MVTITDVAAKAGVSRATVSYVLNERNTSVRISDDTRQRVMESAATLGYRRNELARAVITGKSRMLGFWVMQSNREPVVRVLAGAMKEADESGYFIKMLGFDDNSVDSKIIERCIEWRLSGIIAIHAPEITLNALYPSIVASNIPMIIVDSERPPRESVHIASDGALGMRSVVEHLVQLGHRSIALIAGQPDEENTLSQVRTQSYQQAMKDFGLEQSVRIEYGHWDLIQADYGHWNSEPTEAVVRKLLSVPAKVRPTAIACACDHIAMVTIRTAVKMGIKVPEELSVTGFDDLSAAPLYNPPLTTVSQSFEAMGGRAVKRLIAQVEGKGGLETQDEDLLQTQLIVRESTAPAKSN
ncbi:MAG TPA: LacI family DNA-binding transcriptional regulator [Abditibacteriaceae bacterium]|jgi:LacI family transcriptional regulator